MLPQRLAAFQSEICACDPEAQTFRYNAESWARSFDGDADLAALVERFPEKIGRRNLRALSQEAAGDPSLLRRLFLATMVWGFGPVGYGPYRTTHMLAALDAKAMLTTTATCTAEGRLSDAYTGFKLPKCGPAFFTKFFYSIGLGYQLTPQPLVLDSRVAASLQLLACDSGWPLYYFTKSSGYVTGFPKGYIRYLEAMHQWSVELGCRPDAIELFLFDPPAEFYTWNPALLLSHPTLANTYGDALRGYAHAVLKRDGFCCCYCGLDGKASFDNWLHLSWDHLLPKGHPQRDTPDYIVAACRFCNEAYNREVWDVEGKSPAELIAQKRGFVLAKRNEYRHFWEQKVS
jgi:hypothetical protein